MKFIKYIAAALLLTVGFASCNNGGDDMGDGTVGKTTVQFAQAEYTSGYGTGMVKVPVTITADKEEDMNSCNVSVKVKPVITGEEYEGTHNETGLSSDGDYAVTSWNLNFPAYAKYFDKKDPTKYYDEATQKWTKTVNLEVKIMNTQSDELHITFEIESVTEGVTIGENRQCKVVLEKTVMDRLGGMYGVTYDEAVWLFGADNRFFKDDPDLGEYFPADVANYAWTALQIVPLHNDKTGTDYFGLASDNMLYEVFGIPFYAYFDPSVEKMCLASKDVLAYLDEAGTIGVVSAIYDVTKNEWATDDMIYLDFDVETGVITLPTDYAFSVSIFGLETGTFMGEMTPAYKGLKFTKVKK